jgi:hypothetical protein
MGSFRWARCRPISPRNRQSGYRHVIYGRCTPLAWAAANRHIGVVRLSLAEGANIDSEHYRERTLLSWAPGYGRETVSSLLINTVWGFRNSRNHDRRVAVDEYGGVLKLPHTNNGINPHAVDNMADCQWTGRPRTGASQSQGCCLRPTPALIHPMCRA